MSKTSPSKVLVLILHAFVIWALCGLVMFIGPKFFSMETTLIIHAIGAPVFASLVSLNYFKRFNYTKPLSTAYVMLSVVIVLDAGLVAPVFEKSYEMFNSILGTWIPFFLIFWAVFFTGFFRLTSD